MKIAIAGYGAEGELNYQYWKALGHDITIVDENATPSRTIPQGARTMLGEGAFSKLHDFDVVIRTAGLSPHKITTDGRVWSATNEFFAHCPAPIIGVTGTKGKGTTCSMIAEILRAAGKTVHLVGNIGLPALGELSKIRPSDIVIYELSSFQLWDLERSPHVAVILHMEPDHLDVHTDMEEYIRAKANIRRYQTVKDICLFAPDNKLVQQIIDMPAGYPQDSFQQRDWRWRAFQYGVRNVRDESVPMVYLDKGIFCIQRPGGVPVTTIHASVMQIPGKHNQMNACAAMAAALQVDDVSDEALTKGISEFSGLPHRLKFVREVSGVKYYDDSIATTPGSAIAAVQSFEGPKVMILGGSAKGATFEALAIAVRDSGVKNVIAIGDEADKIEQAMNAVGAVTFNMGAGVTMKDIVAVAQARAEAGDTVILSPACASFGMFKNYADRGDQFIAAVEAL